MKEFCIKSLATGLGAGLSPYAPGTVGTIMGIPLCLLFSLLTPELSLLSVIAFCFFAVYVSGEAEILYEEKDSRKIVIDEISGYLVAMLFVHPSAGTLAAGFFLFRLFDILKPFPVRLLEQCLPRGYGVVGDDVMAGIYSGVFLRLAVLLSGAI